MPDRQPHEVVGLATKQGDDMSNYGLRYADNGGDMEIGGRQVWRCSGCGGLCVASPRVSCESARMGPTGDCPTCSVDEWEPAHTSGGGCVFEIAEWDATLSFWIAGEI